MDQLQQKDVRNLLLKALSAADFTLLQPTLKPMPAPLRMRLFLPHTAMTQTYFPEQGFASLTFGKIEVGMIGREGVVGVPAVILGDDRSPCECYIQMAGHGHQVSVADLRKAVEQSRSLYNLLRRYIQALWVQTAQTAAANAKWDVETRLARWLLITRDRAEDDDMILTHEFLSVMLGVRRAGVTVAIQKLEGKQLIKAGRGRIRILDRQRLEGAARESYGVAEAEYARLIESR